jgi:Xaa-Pro aminopeptidase
MAFYDQIVAITHAIAAEALSARRITPGVTTIDDLEAWTRERYRELGVGTWFPPMYYIVRPDAAGPATRVIQKGDVVRCDIGITYVGLTSDLQQVAYVLKDGETDAPAGLQAALAKGNRLQDIVVAGFKPGIAGNDALRSMLATAKADGLVPKIYSHPLGAHGHAAGSRLGLPDMQDGVPGMGDYPLSENTVWAVELGVRVPVPEWGGQEIQLALEEDVAFTSAGGRFLDGRQTRFHLVRSR